jgi:hypothetical protein
MDKEKRLPITKFSASAGRTMIRRGGERNLRLPLLYYGVPVLRSKGIQQTVRFGFLH